MITYNFVFLKILAMVGFSYSVYISVVNGVSAFT